MPQVTAVPQAASAMIGVFGRNGHIVMAVDLADAMNLPGGDRSAGHLVSVRHARIRLAFRVDRALAHLKVIIDGDQGSVDPVAPGVVTDYASAVDDNRDIGQRRIALLDTAHLIRPFLPSSRPSGV